MGEFWNPLIKTEDPPEPIQKTMNAICLVLQHKHTKWSEVLPIFKGISTEGFMKFKKTTQFSQRIIDFDIETMTPQMIQELDEMFHADWDWTFDAVNARSNEAGRLYKWIMAIHRIIYLEDEVEKERNAALDRAKLLKKWKLVECASRLEESGYHDSSKWHEITDEDLKK